MNKKAENIKFRGRGVQEEWITREVYSKILFG